MKPVPTFRCGSPLLLLAAALLGGCAATGGLHPTVAPTDPAGLGARASLAGVKLDPAAWPREAWWKAVGDPQLDKLVDEALADNPDMTLVDARVRAALAAAGAADAQRKPTLNGGAQMSGARVPPLLPPIADGHWGVIRFGYLSFKWDLDPWGGKRAAWQAAVGQARAAAVDAQAARLRLATDVVQAYFNLAGAYALRDLSREQLQRADDFLRLTREQATSGIVSRFNLVQIESETESDRVRLRAADNAVHTAGLMLAALLGAGPDRAASITQPSLPSVPALSMPSDLPAELLGRRPDVVAARWRAEAASHDIKAAKARFLPNVSISSLAGLIAPSSMDLFSLRNRFYTFGPALSLPIFEGGALRANLAGADAARDEAVAQYNQVLVQAINQVATQVDDLRALDDEVHNAAAARDREQQAYTLSLQRFHAGIGSFLEALTVRQQLITAEQQLAQIQIARGQAWAALNQALGGGFKPAADAAPLAEAAQDPPKVSP